VVVINRPIYVQRPVPVQHPVYVQRPVVVQRPPVNNRPPMDHRPVEVRPPVTRTQYRNEPAPRRYNGPPSPAVREQQRAHQEIQQNYYQRMPEARRGPTVQPQSRGEGTFRPQQQQHRDDRRRG
jgi:hypothetical protein